MKKILAIILLLAMCFNGTAYYFIFKFRQEKARKEIKMMIKAGVPDAALSVIRRTAENADDFHWIHSREFRYQGVMYDVVRSEKAADGATLLHCVTDHQETLLFVNLGRMAERRAAEHPGHSKSTHLLSLLLSGLFFSPYSKFECPEFNPLKIVAAFDILYQQPGIFIDTPPPRLS